MNKGKKTRSHLEETLSMLLIGSGVTGFERDYKFNLPKSRHELDFFWKNEMVGIEVQGGIFGNKNRGGHVRAIQYSKDRHKINIATLAGIRVLEFTTIDFKEPLKMIKMIKELLKMTLK